MMSAIYYSRYGGPDQLLMERIPQPKLFRKRFVVVRIMATSINALDWKLRAGHVPAPLLGLPKIPGLDFSGEVVRVGDLVTKFEVGDQVVGSLDPLDINGSCAEFLQIDEIFITRKPAKISHVEAASVGVVGLASWSALVERGELKEGQKVLINGASGGFGTIAIQLARYLGASEIVATCLCEKRDEKSESSPSTDVEAMLESLGATSVLDYRNLAESLESAGKNEGYFDLVIDTQAGDSLNILWNTARPKTGKIVSLCVESNQNVEQNIQRYGSMHVFPTLAKSIFLKLYSVVTGPYFYPVKVLPSGEKLSKIMTLVESGAIRTVVDRIIPFSVPAVRRAHELLEKGHVVRGKIVIDFNLSFGDEVEFEE